MSELWGAPAGEVAYYKNSLTQMQALGRAADTSLTPDRRALMQAQARGLNATADKNDAAMEALAAVAKWDEIYESREEETERKMIAAAPAATGLPMTIQDSAEALQNPVLAKAKYLQKIGAPSYIYLPLFEKGAKIAHEQAQAYYRREQGETHQLNQEAEEMRQMGEMAADAMESDMAWAEANSNPRTRALIPENMRGLPLSVVKPMLGALAAAATTAQQQADMKIKAAQEKRADALSKDQRTTAAIANAEAKARTAIAKQTYDNKAKYAGHNSQEAWDSAKAAADTKKLQALEEQLLVAPWAPRSEDDMKVGDAYTGNDGVVGIYRGNGQMETLDRDGYLLLLAREAQRLKAEAESPFKQTMLDNLFHIGD